MSDHQPNTTHRPSGTNADEWRLFLCGYLDSRATSVDGLSFVAVQIAEAIEAERERCARIAENGHLIFPTSLALHVEAGSAIAAAIRRGK